MNLKIEDNNKKVGVIVTDRDGDFDKVVVKLKTNKIHTLNYTFYDGKTVTKKFTWETIVNDYISFRDFMEEEISQGMSLRHLCNEGVYMYSFLKTYGNTLKNRNLLKRNSTNTELLKCIISFLKGSRRYKGLIKSLFTTKMYLKFMECIDLTETVVNLHDVSSFELLSNEDKELRLKELESYKDENSKDFWKKQEMVKRNNVSWDDFKQTFLNGFISTTFGLETIH